MDWLQLTYFLQRHSPRKAKTDFKASNQNKTKQKETWTLKQNKIGVEFLVSIWVRNYQRIKSWKMKKYSNLLLPSIPTQPVFFSTLPSNEIWAFFCLFVLHLNEYKCLHKKVCALYSDCKHVLLNFKNKNISISVYIYNIWSAETVGTSICNFWHI